MSKASIAISKQMLMKTVSEMSCYRCRYLFVHVDESRILDDCGLQSKNDIQRLIFYKATCKKMIECKTL